ncbi:MAG: SemiSWEET family transporter [Nitrososphaerales archaeon]
MNKINIMIDAFQIVGFIALIASSVGFFPQVVKTFKTKKAEDLSFYTLLLLIIAATSWIAYGFSRSDLFIIWTNSIIFVLVLMLAIMKISYRKS